MTAASSIAISSCGPRVQEAPYQKGVQFKVQDPKADHVMPYQEADAQDAIDKTAKAQP
jgi:hypothetical protein